MIPHRYLPPMGMPLYWRDDQSGRLPAAMKRYSEFCCGDAAEPTAEQMGLIAAYCVYWIHAPCWDQTNAECEEMLEVLNELRARAGTLASVESIRRWNEECLELGIDPF